MSKFSLFPIKKYNFWKLYKKQQGALWTAEEIDFSKDYDGFINLDEDQQYTLKIILAFFANSDGLVNYNIKNNFLNNFSDEITYTYIFQMYMENVHNETYSLMIESLIKDDKEKEDLFNSLSTNEIIKEISEWGLNYSNNDYSLSEKILVFICFEGIMFSGAFAIIFWLKKFCTGNKILPGLLKSNELISRDEGMHVEFGIELMKEQLSRDNINDTALKVIILECVELTKKFNKEILKTRQIGMNEELMNQYTEYVSDRIFVELNMTKQYHATNPFGFMNTIGMMQKTNFHDSRPTEYQRAPKSTAMAIIDDF